MSNFILSCCSTADLSLEYLLSRDIKYVCFHYFINDKEYLDDLGQTMSLPEFYRMMDEDDIMTRTSQINVTEYTEYFDKMLAEGNDILHLTLSSGISGTVNSARLAAEDLRKKYPERKLIIIDTLCASSGYGLLVDKAADLRDSGMSIDETAKWIEENKLRVNHWFYSTTLKFYIRGGRVSKPAGFIGGLLGICPLLHVDNAGKLIPMEKIRTKQKTMEAAFEKMVAMCQDGDDYSEKCFISQSNAKEDAEALAALIEAHFHKMNGKVHIFDIGTVIGSHSGPGTIALFFWGKDAR